MTLRAVLTDAVPASQVHVTDSEKEQLTLIRKGGGASVTLAVELRGVARTAKAGPCTSSQHTQIGMWLELTRGHGVSQLLTTVTKHLTQST